MKQNYAGYGWIKAKKYSFDHNKSWEERYKALEQHHVEETQFLIEKVRELDAELQKLKAMEDKKNFQYCRDC